MSSHPSLSLEPQLHAQTCFDAGQRGDVGVGRAAQQAAHRPLIHPARRRDLPAAEATCGHGGSQRPDELLCADRLNGSAWLERAPGPLLPRHQPLHRRASAGTEHTQRVWVSTSPSNDREPPRSPTLFPTAPAPANPANSTFGIPPIATAWGVDASHWRAWRADEAIAAGAWEWARERAQQPYALSRPVGGTR